MYDTKVAAEVWRKIGQNLSCVGYLQYYGLTKTLPHRPPGFKVRFIPSANALLYGSPFSIMLIPALLSVKS